MDIVSFRMKDHVLLPAYTTRGQTPKPKAVLMLHGITHDMDVLAAAAEQAASRADVYLLILRGYHDRTSPGALTYHGQTDDDIESVLHALKQSYDHVTLAGHSMGAGSVLRYMQEKDGRYLDDAVLAAPFLHPAHPVFAPNDGSDDTYKLSLKKAAAAAFLTRAGVQAAGRMHIVDIPLRQDPLQPGSTTYRKKLSYRLMLSRFIEKETDFSRIDFNRTRWITGAEDEIVTADRFVSFCHDHGLPDPVIVPGENHNTLLTSRTFLDILAPAEKQTRREPDAQSGLI
ncbi:alpha/beta fold hydrolase [Alkalicoccus chagannorensis]|uniref:alpha/beta fold hydrolase n=1 Tax=Alkalicoccus chagannorensis TaxID=427072 RepID=UPI0003F506E2|nr:alpha/beta fold hydrolase [Alkalicoccus chagannorensis]